MTKKEIQATKAALRAAMLQGPTTFEYRKKDGTLSGKRIGIIKEIESTGTGHAVPEGNLLYFDMTNPKKAGLRSLVIENLV